MSSWWVVSSCSKPEEGGRLHTCVEGRYVTVFRHRGKLSCIDAICHHAGGPLTLGEIFDIEDLGLTVVSCPW
jgi:nitrite reductase/ring-hydroxylating ferredoxin subunit